MADEAPVIPTPETPTPPAALTPPQTAGQKLAQTLAGTPEAKPEAPPAADPAEAPKPTLAERLKADGFEGIESDEQATERLLEAYRRERQEAETARAQAQEQARINAALAAGRPAEPVVPQTQTATEESWWKPPVIDDRMVEIYQTRTIDPATGREKVGWRDGTPADVIAKANEVESYYKQWANDLVQRPHEVLPKIIAAEARKIVREELSQTQEQQQSVAFLDNFRKENAWLYENDPVTNRPAITAEGSFRLTAEGQKFQSYLTEAEELGISNVQKQFAYAQRLRAADMAASKAATAPRPSDINDQKKRELLAAGNGGAIPDRSGSLPTPARTGPTPTQNKNLTAGEKLRQQLQKDGVAV